jgi:class 3 adenylate cyclase
MAGGDADGKGGKLTTSAALSKAFGNELFATKPIADLFPHATVMFADIVGFTAWASVREPSQVFTLLETVYDSFEGAFLRSKPLATATLPLQDFQILERIMRS